MAQQRTVSVGVKLLAENYFAGLKKMQTETAKTALTAEQSFNKQKAGFTALGQVSLATSAVLTGAFVAMVKASADFEQRMSQVQALSKATASQMQNLRNAAFTAGKAFGLSATQVADAQIELTKAGVSVKDIIGGALPGALALAAAGQIDVAKATEIASNAMTEFKLRGSDVPHVADLLAAGADKSVASVESLGDALNQSGLVASQFGLSIEDTVGTLTAFSKAGLNGSDAGTSFKTMLTQLASPSKQAAEELRRYNIQTYDAQGNFVGITNLADQLQKNLGKVSQAQRNAALSTIFGNDAIRASSALYDLGGKKLQGFIDANNEAGFAALQASKKLDNLNGDVQKLGAVFQNDLIKSGSAANDQLRGLAQGVSGLLGFFGDLPKPIQATALGLTGVGAATSAAGAAFFLLTPKIAEAKLAMKDLNLTGKGLAATFGKGAALTVGISALVGGLANLSAEGTVNAEQLEQAAKRVRGSYKDIDKAFPSASVFDLGGGGADASLEVLDGLLGKTNQLAANFLDGASAALTFGTAGTHLGDVFKSNRETFEATGTALAGLAKQDYSASAASFNRLVDQLGGGADKAQKLIRNLGPDFTASLSDLAKEAGVAATSTNKLSIATGKGLAADALRIAQAGAQNTAQSFQELSGSAVRAGIDISGASKAIAGFGSAALDARSAARAFEQAVDDASATAKKNGRTLNIATQAGRDNQAALDGIASAASQAAAKILEQSGSQDQAAAAIRRGRKAFVDAAVQMGLTRAAAGKLADQLNLIPSKVGTAVTLTGAGAALGALNDVAYRLGALNGRTARVAVQYTQIGKQPATGGAQYGFASGGMMPNIGPKGKDSFLIAAGAGEYMFKSSTVDKAGGAGAMRRIDAAIQAGTLRGYKDGGAIGDSATAAAKALRDINRYTAQLKSAKATESRAEKAYDAIDGSKKNAAAKKAAKRRQDAAQKRVDDLQKRLDDARQARSEANSATVALRNDRTDFVSGQRRATADNPIDPLSYIDQLRSMSRDSNFSQKRRSTYDAAANKYEKSLVDLATKSAAAASKLDDLKSSADSMKSSIGSAISGGYQLSNVGSTSTATGSFLRNGIRFSSYGSGVSASSIDAYYKQGAADTSSFAADLKQLASRGVAPALLAELAGYGVAQGAPLAKSLLAGTSGQIASINQSYNSIQGNAAAAAGTVTDANFAAQISAAQKNADQITAQLASDGEKLRKLIASAFGVTGYAIGTMNATPGWHLVGERGPELIRTNGGEQVATATRTRSMIAAAQSRRGGTWAGPSSVTIIDADGALIGSFATAARGVARMEIAKDALADSVHTMYGGAV